MCVSTYIPVPEASRRSTGLFCVRNRKYGFFAEVLKRFNAARRQSPKCRKNLPTCRLQRDHSGYLDLEMRFLFGFVKLGCR